MAQQDIPIGTLAVFQVFLYIFVLVVGTNEKLEDDVERVYFCIRCRQSHPF